MSRNYFSCHMHFKEKLTPGVAGNLYCSMLTYCYIESQEPIDHSAGVSLGVIISKHLHNIEILFFLSFSKVKKKYTSCTWISS